MNYRHDFHAGSFADVVKHAVLCRVLAYLRQKPAAFRVIDTHAGSGIYNLAADEATRGGEWRDGIGHLVSANLSKPVADLLAPYLDVIGAMNERGNLKTYPGSPALVRAWLRPQDRFVACELEPHAAAALAAHMRGDSRIKCLEIDGWTAWSAYVPPVERRGLVLVDPPFEQEGDYGRLAHGLSAALRKWATGIYMIWYPIKGRPQPDALAKNVRRNAGTKILRIELTVSTLADPSRLNGTGLMIANPPWTLAEEMTAILPELVRMFARDARAGFRVDWLVAERAG